MGDTRNPSASSGDSVRICMHCFLCAFIQIASFALISWFSTHLFCKVDRAALNSVRLVGLRFDLFVVPSPPHSIILISSAQLNQAKPSIDERALERIAKRALLR